MHPASALNRAMVCDFCNGPSPVRSYEAAPIILHLPDGLVHFCDSKWAACAICAQFIDHHLWDALTDRCFDLWMRSSMERGEHPTSYERQALKAHMLRLHGLVRNALERRAGP
jgi:hypothetical protein